MSNIKYRALLSAIEEGNLTAAAAKLSYSQPGISHMIDYLEKELGFSLLTRLKSGVIPTEEANILLPHIRQMINAEDRIYEISKQIKGIESGQVRIGTYFSISVYWLPKIISAFEKQRPNISLRLSEGDGAEVAQGIKSGSLDISFISETDCSGIDFIPITKDPIMAILPKGHPLAQKETVDLKELTKYPFIYSTESSYEEIYKMILSDSSIALDIKYRVKGDEAILAMASEGLGVSLMPKLLFDTRHDSRLSIRPLNKSISRTLGIALRSKEFVSPAAKSFITTALEVLKEQVLKEEG